MHFVHHPGDPFTAALTLPVGSVLQVRLEPAAGYSWTTLTSSEPRCAEVTATTVDADGTATATLTLRAPGAAALTATTSYQPDPHGPPTRLWRLTITITA